MSNFTIMARTRKAIMVNHKPDKNKTIRAKRGEKDKTALVKISCAIDPGDPHAGGGEATQIGWGGLLTWTQGLGHYHKKHYYAEKLTDIVGDVSKDIRAVLREKKGEIPAVDVIFKMPTQTDTRLTIYYESDLEIEDVLNDPTRDADMNSYD